MIKEIQINVIEHSDEFNQFFLIKDPKQIISQLMQFSSIW